MNDDFIYQHRPVPDDQFGISLYQQLQDADETLAPVTLSTKPRRPQIWLRLVATLLMIIAAGVVALQSSNHTISPNLAQIDTRLLLGDLQPITRANASQLIEVANLGKGSALNVATSPDGKTLAVGTSKGIAFYNADLTGTPRFMPTPLGGMSAYDGKRVAVMDQTSIRIWDAATGVQQTMLSFDPGTTFLVQQFSPDGRWFAAGGSIDNTQGSALYIWDAATGALYTRLITPAVPPIEALAFSPDSLQLAVQSVSGIGIYDLKLASRTIIETTNSNSAHNLTFSPDGSVLAVAHPNSVYLWSTGAHKLIQTIPIGTQNSSSIINMAYSTDGSLLAIADQNYGVMVWDLKASKFLLPPHSTAYWQDISNLSFSPDSTNLNFIRFGKTIVVEDAHTGTVVAQRTDYDGSMYGLSLNPDNVTTATQGSDGTIQLHDLKTGELIKTLNVGLDYLDHITFSPDGQALAVSGYNFVPDPPPGIVIGQGIKLINWQNGSEIARFGSELSTKSLLNAFTFAANDHLIAYDPNGSQPRLLWWDLAHPNQPNTLLTGSLLQAQEVQLSSNGSILAIYGYPLRGQTHIYNMSTGEELDVPGLDQFSPDSIALSPDGSQIALLTNTISSVDRQIVVFDLKTKSFYLHPLATSQRIYRLVFSPDSKLIAAAGLNTFMLFDASSGEPLFTSAARLGQINKLVFSSDSRYIVGSVYDSFIRVWGVPPEDKP